MSDAKYSLRRELKLNGNAKAKIVIVLYRLATLRRRKNPLLKLLSLPFVILNKVINEWFFSVEIPWQTQIGAGLRIYHAHCIVLNRDVIIGNNCILRHGVTIGNATDDGSCPKIGDNVEFGAGAIVIGEITLGEGAKVGAGAVVTKDMPSGAIAVGQPCRIVKR
ncbi:MAG: serine acetyltransferase [Scandinavium sp.]|uniref:serine acetyltransferase n=1 Tax=Scandinavium sp. TaxID=2830653 RepID=UPI003F3A8F3B